ncbi:unnamed protein product [Lampetra fluviatilis]
MKSGGGRNRVEKRLIQQWIDHGNGAAATRQHNKKTNTTRQHNKTTPQDNTTRQHNKTTTTRGFDTSAAWRGVDTRNNAQRHACTRRPPNQPLCRGKRYQLSASQNTAPCISPLNQQAFDVSVDKPSCSELD